MKWILTAHPDFVGRWVCERAGGEWSGVGATFGLVERDGGKDTLIAGVLFDSFNGANINMHVAALPGRRWMTREFLFAVFDYPFRQLGVKRITGLVAASNADARRFDEHIGFKLEATLKDAHPDGDLLVYCMTREDCRWLQLRSRYGKEQRTVAA